MEVSCPLGTTRLVWEKNFLETHIANPLLTNLVQSRWLDIGIVLSCKFMDLETVSVAKRELGQYQAILTSRLDNNPNINPYI